MELIQDFNTLSVEEQEAFAREFVQKINDTKVFTDEVDFVFDVVDADEISGDLYIGVYTKEGQDIAVERKASWTCGSVEDLYDNPEDVEFDEYIETDVTKALKTLTTELDGYIITIEVDDADGDTIDREVKDYSNEDDGIGSYEYWGFTGYDSRPYVAVTGIITQACGFSATLTVSPVSQDKE